MHGFSLETRKAAKAFLEKHSLNLVIAAHIDNRWVDIIETMGRVIENKYLGGECKKLADGSGKHALDAMTDTIRSRGISQGQPKIRDVEDFLSSMKAVMEKVQTEFSQMGQVARLLHGHPPRLAPDFTPLVEEGMKADAIASQRLARIKGVTLPSR